MKYLVLVILFFPQPSGAEIYKWVDVQGRIHFGDTPKAEDSAEEVVVDPILYEFEKASDIDYFKTERIPITPTVEMFSASWCSTCKVARKYFQKHNIKFVEYDIDESKSAIKRFEELGGRGIPLILVGEKKMSGFSPGWFERLYQ